LSEDQDQGELTQIHKQLHVPPFPAFNITKVKAESMQALACVQQLSAGSVELELEFLLCRLIKLNKLFAHSYSVARTVSVPESPQE